MDTRMLRRCLLSLMVIVGVAPIARAAIERTVTKDFAVKAGAALKIDTCQGGIRIEPSADNQIHVLVRETIAAADEAEADRRIQVLDFKIEQSAAGVVLQARYRLHAHWFWQTWPSVGLSYVVKVPRACDLDLATPEGDITVGPVEGTVRLRVGTGTVFVGAVKGSVEAAVLRGDVAITACSGALTLVARVGNVLVGRAEGLTKINGSGGTIEIQNSRGNLHVDGDGADLKVGFAYPLTEPSELSAAGGDIEVAFDPRSTGMLSARASVFGAVKVKNLALKIESGKIGSSHIIATLNGGGPKILIAASGGNVRLSGREP
jgi:hypothetical protein